MQLLRSGVLEGGLAGGELGAVGPDDAPGSEGHRAFAHIAHHLGKLGHASPVERGGGGGREEGEGEGDGEGGRGREREGGREGGAAILLKLSCYSGEPILLKIDLHINSTVHWQ